MDETKYEVNIFNDGKWHVKILANHTEEIKNTVAKLKEILGPQVDMTVKTGSTNGNGASVKVCETHNVDLDKNIYSKKKERYYAAHELEDGSLCFGS